MVATTTTTETIMDVVVQVTSTHLQATKQVWIVSDHTHTTLVETIQRIQAIYILVCQQR